MLKRLWPLVLPLLIGLAAATCAQEPEIDASIAQWEKHIVKLEQLDDATPKAKQAILFYGSSSIGRWKTIADDMSPWPVIRRGYGRAKLPGVIHYAPRVVGPQIGVANPNRCRAVVLFVANDITDKNTHLITTAGAYLGLDGRPSAELFARDRLHLSESGYQSWASLLKAQLHSKLGGAMPASEVDLPRGPATPAEPTHQSNN